MRPTAVLTERALLCCVVAPARGWGVGWGGVGREEKGARLVGPVQCVRFCAMPGAEGTGRTCVVSRMRGYCVCMFVLYMG